MSDYELPKVFTSTTPKARVEHDCVECDVKIQPGQTYERVKGLWDDSWLTIKTCLPCVELRRKFAGEFGEYEYGALREAMAEANR